MAALWPDVSLETIVRRARLLVIDDEDFPYRDLFRKAGFSLEKWNDVTRLQDLEAGNFDLILLDLQGIGRRLSSDQGLGVLEHLKNHNPDQLIVAYSNAEFGVKYQRFFDLADAVLDKSADYLDFKRVVEDLLLSHFNPNTHAERLQGALTAAGYKPRQAKKMVASLVATEDLPATRRALVGKLGESALTDNILRLAEITLKVVALCRS